MCLEVFDTSSVSSMVDHIAICAGGMGFNSQAAQIAHSVDSGSPPLRRFFGAAEIGPAFRYTLRRNTASIMKILILFVSKFINQISETSRNISASQRSYQFSFNLFIIF